MMIGILWVDVIVAIVKFLMPVVAILSLLLFLKPKFYVDLEKRLSYELGTKALSKKTVKSLEQENLALQNMLLSNSRAVGLMCFLFSIVLVMQLFK